MVAKKSIVICKKTSIVNNDQIQKNVQWWQNS